MDVKSAFQNSPIWLPHKVFCVVEWQAAFFLDHVFPFGLAMAPGLQGCITDAMVDILDAWEISPVFKWVDDFNFMHEPCKSVTCKDGSIDYFYAYNLGDVIRCTDNLGIPWHSIEKKVHDFAFLAMCVGFDWDLHACTVSIPKCKCSKYAAQVAACLSTSKVSLDEVMKIQGTLQHMTFVITAGSAYLHHSPMQLELSKGTDTATTTSHCIQTCTGGNPSCQDKTFHNCCSLMYI